MNVVSSNNNLNVLGCFFFSIHFYQKHVDIKYSLLYLLDPEAGMLDHVPDDGHDLSGELPLLQPEGGAGRVGVLQPVRQEHVVGRHLRE